MCKRGVFKDWKPPAQASSWQERSAKSDEEQVGRQPQNVRAMGRSNSARPELAVVNDVLGPGQVTIAVGSQRMER